MIPLALKKKAFIEIDQEVKLKIITLIIIMTIIEMIKDMNNKVIVIAVTEVEVDMIKTVMVMDQIQTQQLI